MKTSGDLQKTSFKNDTTLASFQAAGLSDIKMDI